MTSDPFALGGREDDQVIVDHDALDVLFLVADEPVLGPLVREQFEAEELWGNTRGDDPRWDGRMRRCIELDKTINTCRAETIGGIAWRLQDLNRVIQDEEGVSDWTRAGMQAVCDEAIALAKAKLRKPD